MRKIIFILLLLALPFIGKSQTIVDTMVAEIYTAEHYPEEVIKAFIRKERRNSSLMRDGNYVKLMFSQLGYMIVERNGPEVQDITKILGYFDIHFEPIDKKDVYDFYTIGSLSYYK